MFKSYIKGSQKGTIFYLHGNSSSSYVFKRVLESEKVLNTQIAVDLPGHGKSTKNGKEENYTTEKYCEALVECINAINDDILLVGNSLGGHLTLEFANKISRLKGLLIFGAPPLKKPMNFEEAFLPVPALQTFLTEHPAVEEIKAAGKVALFDKKYIPGFIQDFQRTDSKVRTALARDLENGTWKDQEQIFIKLNAPKFIIIGDQDPTVNSKYLERVNEKCMGNCEIIRFTDCGHYPSLEKSEEFVEAINYITSKVFNS